MSTLEKNISPQHLTTTPQVQEQLQKQQQPQQQKQENAIMVADDGQATSEQIITDLTTCSTTSTTATNATTNTEEEHKQQQQEQASSIMSTSSMTTPNVDCQTNVVNPNQQQPLKFTKEQASEHHEHQQQKQEQQNSQQHQYSSTATQQQEQQQHQQHEQQKTTSATSTLSTKHQFLHTLPININKVTSNLQMSQNTDVGGYAAVAGAAVVTSLSACSTANISSTSCNPTTSLYRQYTAQKLYVKALYDNVPDSPDELAFRKGDILAVMEQDTDGLVGWWLCTLRGRQGLCPGNRLRILNSYDSGCFSPSPTSSPCPSLAASTATLNSSICSADIYENTSIISSSGSSSGVSSSGISTNSGSGSGCISASQTQLNTSATAATNLQHHQQQQQHQNQRQGTRRSWHVSPNKVITPQRHGDVYIYNIPQQQLQQQHHNHQQQQKQQQQHQQSAASQLHSQHYLSSAFAHSQLQLQQQQQQQQQQQIYQNLPDRSSISSEFDTYDIPKPAVPINYDTPRSVLRNMAHLQSAAMKACSTPIQEENYDVPRPLTSLLQHQNTLTPSSSNSSLLTSDSLSLSFSSSNRSSLINMPDYDIPRRNPLPVRALLQQQQQAQQQQQRPSSRASVNGNCSTYDLPMPTNGVDKNGVNQGVVATKELPLELTSALETLAKLQSETTTAISRLLAFVSHDWRCREKLEPVLMEVKLAAVRLRTALHDLAEFGEGALGNASKSEDRTLAQKLKPIIRALRDANKLVQDSCEVLEANGGWSLELLLRSDDKSTCRPPDSLDRLIACAQTLTEDVRSTTSFIQGNASLLFKRQLTEVIEETVSTNQSSSVPQTPTAGDANSAEWLEDYDYVSFESKDAAARKNSSLREAIPENLKNKFDTVLRVAENSILNTGNNMVTTPNGKKAMAEMTDKDKMLVRYYAVQISTHMGNLRQAIDSFLETVEKNQPPKFFIAYGKFVVVSAHNLVTIGDIVHRNVSKADLKEKILRCTNNLAEALKTCVMKSKQAAAHFPSVTAVQEMVDSVVDISHLASDLKTVMLHAVQLTI